MYMQIIDWVIVGLSGILLCVIMYLIGYSKGKRATTTTTSSKK